MAKRLIDIDWIIENYLPFLQKFGMEEQNIRNHFDDWKQGKSFYIVNDYLWYIFQKIILAIGEQCKSEEQLYSYNIEINSKMWEFLVKVENKNPNHVKRVMHENELRLWQLQTEYKVEVEIVSGQCCTFCNNLHGKHLSFNEALEKQYLASKQCTREWGCNCCYVRVPLRDKNGRLIPI